MIEIVLKYSRITVKCLVGKLLVIIKIYFKQLNIIPPRYDLKTYTNTTKQNKNCCFDECFASLNLDRWFFHGYKCENCGKRVLLSIYIKEISMWNLLIVDQIIRPFAQHTFILPVHIFPESNTNVCISLEQEFHLQDVTFKETS